MTHQELHNIASTQAQIAFDNETDHGFGSCGFAFVQFSDGRQPFTKWIKAKENCSYEVTVGANTPTQSIDKKEAWCNAYAKVMKQHNVKCFVRSGLL